MAEGTFLKIVYHDSRNLTHLKKYWIIPDIDSLPASSDIYTEQFNCTVTVLNISFIVVGPFRKRWKTCSYLTVTSCWVIKMQEVCECVKIRVSA